MTILSIAQTCAGRLQLPQPTTFVGSTNNNDMFLLQMIYRTIFEIRDSFAWPELQKEYPFLTIDGLEAYKMPQDFNFTLTETLWNKDQHWPLLGPIDPVQWQSFKSGWVATIPQSQYRVKGWNNNQFFINPTPSATQLCIFEYISRSAFRPKTWAASTAYTLNTYVSYDGLILKCTTAGTTDTVAGPEVGRDNGVFWKSIPAYVLGNSYYVDQYVNNSAKVYKCTVAGKGLLGPTHTSGSATTGTATFEFISAPDNWAGGTNYVEGDVIVNDNAVTFDYYICAVGGLSGAYAPQFHATLSQNNVVNETPVTTILDGTAVWTLIETPYETFLADTDEVILDFQQIVDGAVWRFKQERGLPYQALKQDAEDQLEIAKTNLTSSDVLSANRRALYPMWIGYPYSYPVGNYGI